MNRQGLLSVHTCRHPQDSNQVIVTATQWILLGLSIGYVLVAQDISCDNAKMWCMNHVRSANGVSSSTGISFTKKSLFSLPVSLRVKLVGLPNSHQLYLRKHWCWTAARVLTVLHRKGFPVPTVHCCENWRCSLYRSWEYQLKWLLHGVLCRDVNRKGRICRPMFIWTLYTTVLLRVTHPHVCTDLSDTFCIEKIQVRSWLYQIKSIYYH
jgi:hypothetical protein